METGVFSVSNGARRFTRYGYADFLAARKPLSIAVSPLAWNPAASALWRPGDGRGFWTHLQLLRRGRARHHGTAHLQRTRRVWAAGRPLRLRRRIPQPEIWRLGKIRILLSCLGTVPLQPGCRSGGLAQIPEEQFWTGRELGRNRFGQCQPRSAAGDLGSSAFCVQSCLLARDIRPTCRSFWGASVRPTATRLLRSVSEP